MSRFGVKILLYYRIQPKHSNYILINNKTYYHPYEIDTTQNVCTNIIKVGDVQYESHRSHIWTGIHYETGKTRIAFCHYNTLLLTGADAYRIVLTVQDVVYTIHKQQKFVMDPIVYEFLDHVEALDPTSVYDLYRQSIPWLLEFAKKAN